MLRDDILRMVEYGVKQSEISKRAGVSAMSISNYLWYPERCSREIEDKIAAAVKEIKNGIAGTDNE